MDKKIPNISQLKAYLNGNTSVEEEILIENWLDQSPNHTKILEDLADSGSVSNPNYQHDKIKRQIFEKIGFPENRVLPSDFKNHRAPAKFQILFKVAALVIVAITAGLLSWNLTRSDSSEEITYHEIFSPARTVTSYTLPDGSSVELNANSWLKYPSTFSKNEREIYLEGEAFFDVVSDFQRPFKVYSGQLLTTVLGTKFNVNYMKSLEKVEVSLVEGSVEVEFLSNDEKTNTALLQPNEWIYFSENNLENFIVRKGVSSKILWRDGILEFKENTLEEVALTLANWYGVEFEITDHSIRNRKIVGSFKDKSLEHVLETIKFIAGIDYEIEKKLNEEVKVILTEQLQIE